MTPGDSAQAAAGLVRAGDPLRFAAAMAAPEPGRAALLALYALNLELARAPWASTEPMVAEMRLQWWIDALEALVRTGRAPAHEIGPALAQLVADGLDLSPMLALAEARRWDCWRDPFADAAALDAYLAATSGGLYQITAAALGASAEASPVLADYGYAAGLAAFLRAIPALEARGRVPLVDGRPDAVAALAGRGLAALARARAQRGAVPRAALPALLPGAGAGAILARVVRAPGLVAAGGLARSEFARRARLAWMAMTGRW